MILEILTFFLGIIYGYSRKGREDLIGILKAALKFAIILGIVLAVVSFLAFPHPAVIFVAGIGFFALLFIILYFAVIFLVGVVVGDVLERAT